MEKQTKILIIDDDPDFVEAVKVVLEGRYRVAIASNGKEGFQMVREEKPDAIILDVMMARLDEGFDVGRRLKKSPEYKQIPILMLTSLQRKTGFDFKPEAGDEVWLPVEDYLDKPVAPSELLARIEKLLEKRIQ